MIDLRIDANSGLAPYAQIVQQVKQALRMGWLKPGDRLPTAHQVASSVAINPNTVQKAYRELELAGLIAGRPGQGTFVQRSLVQSTPATINQLSRRLDRWLSAARAAGLDDDGILDIVETTLRRSTGEAIA